MNYDLRAYIENKNKEYIYKIDKSKERCEELSLKLENEQEKLKDLYTSLKSLKTDFIKLGGEDGEVRKESDTGTVKESVG